MKAVAIHAGQKYSLTADVPIAMAVHLRSTIVEESPGQFKREGIDKAGGNLVCELSNRDLSGLGFSIGAWIPFGKEELHNVGRGFVSKGIVKSLLKGFQKLPVDVPSLLATREKSVIDIQAVAPSSKCADKADVTVRDGCINFTLQNEAIIGVDVLIDRMGFERKRCAQLSRSSFRA